MRIELVKRLACIALVASSWILPAKAAQAGDTYYMIVFAYQGKPNLARSAHTFATFVKIPDGKDGKPDLKRAQSHTISWLPASLVVVPLRLRPEPGKNLGLRETLDLAVSQDDEIMAWGPYQIQKDLYSAALAQIDRLNRGAIAYKALDARFRPDAATNCFHAVSDIIKGPLLDTGTAFGGEASVMVRDHLAGGIIEPTVVHPRLIAALGLDRYPISFSK